MVFQLKCEPRVGHPCSIALHLNNKKLIKDYLNNQFHNPYFHIRLKICWCETQLQVSSYRRSKNKIKSMNNVLTKLSGKVGK